MLERMNLSLSRGEDAVFEVPLSTDDQGGLDISAADAVRVDVFRLGALAAEPPLIECTVENNRILKVVESGAEVRFRFLIPKEASAVLPAGDYRWVESDVQNGLKTETIGGVITVV